MEDLVCHFNGTRKDGVTIEPPCFGIMKPVDGQTQLTCPDCGREHQLQADGRWRLSKAKDTKKPAS